MLVSSLARTVACALDDSYIVSGTVRIFIGLVACETSSYVQGR